jgi:hypothetical protein
LFFVEKRIYKYEKHINTHIKIFIMKRLICGILILGLVAILAPSCAMQKKSGNAQADKSKIIERAPCGYGPYRIK